MVGREDLYLGCFPQRSTAKHSAQVVIPTHRPCRSPQSLHSRGYSESIREDTDQGSEGFELASYTNGTCSGVRIVSRLVPAALDRCPRGFTGHVAHPSRSIRCVTR